MSLTDPPAAPLGQFRTMQRDRPVPVATRPTSAADSANSVSSGVMGGTARTVHTMVRTCHGLQLLYTNFRAAAGPSESDDVSTIIVTASIDVTGGNAIPVTFNGRRQARIEPGGFVLSDPVGATATKGAVARVATWVGVMPGGKFPTNLIVSDALEGHNYTATGGAELTQTGDATPAGTNLNTWAYGPTAILGRPTDPGKPVVLISGDSIFYGSQDNSTGYAVRGLAGNYSHLKIAYPGEALAQFLSSAGIYRRRRMSLAELVGVTHVVTDYTVNSLAVATIQADAVKAWRILCQYGPLRAATLTPQTSSTDGWATTANQSVLYPSDREPRRLAFNAWLRDGAPINASDVPQSPGATGSGIVRAGDPAHPLAAGIIEAADIAETARNSGIWKAGYTGDGTHPNSTGATALAAAIKPSEWFGAPST